VRRSVLRVPQPHRQKDATSLGMARPRIRDRINQLTSLSTMGVICPASRISWLSKCLNAHFEVDAGSADELTTSVDQHG
jgi:hypothetical protein